MKFFYSLVCFLLFVFNSYGQTHDEDKIKVIDSLIELSYYERTTVNLVKSFEYAIEAMYLSEEINHSKGKARSYFFAGQALYGIGSYKQAMEYLSMADNERYTRTNPQLLAELYRVRGRVYGSVGFNDLSVSEFKKGLVTITQLKDKAKINQYKSLMYENLSHHYNLLQRLDSVKYYLDQNKEILKLTEGPFIYSNWSGLYGAYGELYMNRQQFDSAEYYFNKALDIASKHDYKYVSRVYINWGKMELKKENYDSALALCYKALDNLNETGLKGESPELYTQMAKIYGLKGFPDSVAFYNNNAALINKELAEQKIEAAKKTLDFILLKESERNEKARRRVIYILIPAVFFVVLASIALYVYQRKRRDSALHLKEEESRVLRKKINSSFTEVVELAKSNDSLFLTRFSEVYPEFVRKLLDLHPDLTTSELSLCAMTFLNFSSKEISQYTFIEHRSVQTKKTRLRRRLQLSSGADLYHYFQSISDT